ncbi:MAG TPA: hypothetical protein VGK32_20820 [Vicinamibacterales bacterium]
MSPDGRFFFFSSNAPRERGLDTLSGSTHARLVELNASPQNGNSDIFWVSADIIETLRPTAKR